MKLSPLHVAKREMQQLLTSRVTWVCLGAVGLVLGLAGPFGTIDYLGPVPLMVYWMAITIVFYWVGAVVTSVTVEFLSQTGWPGLILYGLGGAVAGCFISILLIGLNALVFDMPLDCLPCLAGLAANVIAIAMIVSGTIHQVVRHLDATQAVHVSAQPQTAAPSILRRLPIEKRGVLISMSVSDHYVEVVTDQGSELILQRLSDAMSETEGTSGMQVHRSHWVALDQVVSARREGAKAVLTMKDGRDIPASRTYVPALKEAGILPA